MTKVKIFHAPLQAMARDCGNIVGIECDGHSCGVRGDGGADIVCASVSLCMEMLETGLRQVIPDVDVSITESRLRGYKSIRWEATESADFARFIAAVVAVTLRNIAATYPRNVSIEEIEEEK
ncbi:MAG: ribosomal-processing cysteine protease Prp [Synergistaceae bacterium]|nr:ribosomal-processing cysteine protease Prp [Synergistaceae bacterium]